MTPIRSNTDGSAAQIQQSPLMPKSIEESIA
jgi:hypothetical protein